MIVLAISRKWMYLYYLVEVIFTARGTIFEIESPFLFGCSFGAVGIETIDSLDGMDENRPIL